MEVDGIRERKPLRLRQYDYDKPGAYFITVCTKDKRCVLGNIVGGDAHIAPGVELTEIGRIVETYLQRIPGIGEYVIMPNHVHVIVRISATDLRQGPMWASAPTGGNVSGWIRSWKTMVTKELGYSIWQRSFYDHVIRNEADYLRISRYIEDNPAKWSEDTYYVKHDRNERNSNSTTTE